jgi:hypothetical protein
VPSASIDVSRISPAPALLRLARPLDRLALRLGRAGARAHAARLGVDRDDDGLRAELLGQLGDEARPRERRELTDTLSAPARAARRRRRRRGCRRRP